MLASSFPLSTIHHRVVSGGIWLALLICPAWMQSAYVRVNQIGYEAGETPFGTY
jgi:hypothetical protein